MLVHILTGLACFFLGSVPFGYLIGKAKGVDIRKQGSGNTGATNTARVLGKAAGLLTLLLDVGKGVFGAYLGSKLDVREPGLLAEPVWACAAGLLTLFGHCFSPFLKFKGGKGVATGLGIFFFLAPFAAVMAVTVFGVAIRVFRYVSVSSILAAISIPLVIYFEPKAPSGVLLLSGIVASCLVILRHRSNISRLVQGTEPKWGRK